MLLEAKRLDVKPVSQIVAKPKTLLTPVDKSRDISQPSKDEDLLASFAVCVPNNHWKMCKQGDCGSDGRVGCPITEGLGV